MASCNIIREIIAKSIRSLVFAKMFHSVSIHLNEGLRRFSDFCWYIHQWQKYNLILKNMHCG